MDQIHSFELYSELIFLCQPLAKGRIPALAGQLHASSFLHRKPPPTIAFRQSSQPVVTRPCPACRAAVSPGTCLHLTAASAGQIIGACNPQGYHTCFKIWIGCRTTLSSPMPY